MIAPNAQRPLVLALNDLRAMLADKFLCNNCERTRRRGYDFTYIDGHRYAYIERLCDPCADERLSLEEGEWTAVDSGFLKDIGLHPCEVSDCRSCEKAVALVGGREHV